MSRYRSSVWKYRKHMSLSRQTCQGSHRDQLVCTPLAKENKQAALVLVNKTHGNWRRSTNKNRLTLWTNSKTKTTKSITSKPKKEQLTNVQRRSKKRSKICWRNWLIGRVPHPKTLKISRITLRRSLRIKSSKMKFSTYKMLTLSWLNKSMSTLSLNCTSKQKSMTSWIISLNGPNKHKKTKNLRLRD